MERIIRQSNGNCEEISGFSVELRVIVSSFCDAIIFPAFLRVVIKFVGWVGVGV